MLRLIRGHIMVSSKPFRYQSIFRNSGKKRRSDVKDLFQFRTPAAYWRGNRDVATTMKIRPHTRDKSVDICSIELDSCRL